MAEDDFQDSAVTGRWTGFYRLPITRTDSFPLVAEIRQSGGRISGEMYDQVTDHSDDFRKVLAARGREIPLGLRLQINLLVLLNGSRSVGYRIRLPDTSDLQGTVRGERVKFTKVYRGTSLSETLVDGEVLSGQEKTGHRVHYSGHQDLVQGCITGRWSIRMRGIFGLILPPVVGGSFELYKKS
jgi:hypothetical protein